MKDTDNKLNGSSQLAENQSALHKLGKGTLIGFTGSALHLVLTVACYGLITRYISTKEFGYLSLSLAIVNVLSIVSCLGFDKSFPSFIAKKLRSKEVSSICRSIFSSFILCILLGMLTAFVVYLFVDHFALIFDKPGYSYSLRTLSFAIPFLTASILMATYLQSFHNVWGKWCIDSLTPLIRLAFIAVLIIWHLSFGFLIWAYVVSFFLVALFLFFYTQKHIPRFFLREVCFPVTNELFRHSFPLFLSGIFVVVLSWSDTIILGFFAPAEQVGVYNAGIRLTQLLRLFYMSVGFIFLPLASQLFAQSRTDDLKLLYASTTKWLVALTFPVFIIFFLAPNYTMGVFFGPKYSYGNELFFRILSLGFFLHILVGLSELSLIAFRRHKTLMLCLFISVVCNLALNFVLIPLYGKVGAAIATSLSVLLDNGLSAAFVYRFSRIHPFTNKYLKMVIFLLATVSAVTILLNANIITLSIWELFVFALLLVPLTLVLTKSVSAEDMVLLRMLKDKLTWKTLFSNGFFGQKHG